MKVYDLHLLFPGKKLSLILGVAHAGTILKKITNFFQNYHRFIQKDFGMGQLVWDPKFSSQVNEKLKLLK